MTGEDLGKQFENAGPCKPVFTSPGHLPGALGRNGGELGAHSRKLSLDRAQLASYSWRSVPGAATAHRREGRRLDGGLTGLQYLAFVGRLHGLPLRF